MTITSFDRVNLRDLRVRIDAALKQVATDLNLKISAAGIQFTPTNCTVKIECSTITPSGEIVTKEVQDFKRYCGMFGLKPEDLGLDFISQGKVYRITGLKPNATRFPVIAERVYDRKAFKFPHTVVLAGIRRPTAAATAA